MAIYLEKLQTKLDAILAKDLDAIVALQTYIPALGNSYNRNQLDTWLKKRSKYLDDGKIYTEAQIDAFYGNLYSSLSTEDKVIADKIVTDEDYDIDLEVNDYEQLVLVMLYHFVKTP